MPAPNINVVSFYSTIFIYSEQHCAVVLTVNKNKNVRKAVEGTGIYILSIFNQLKTTQNLKRNTNMHFNHNCYAQSSFCLQVGLFIGYLGEFGAFLDNWGIWG